MKDLKGILRRSVRSGFDLSFVENYNEKRLLQGLYDFLVKNHYYCCMENKVVYVGINVVEDIAEVRIENKTMKVKPLTEKGFFEVLVSLFKYVKHLSSFVEEISEQDISTETDSDDESSEELWL
jgi:hypothetical protein|tara:strand:+ start:172 stop:543 length:372 start_codon:yes stop_codon:yes gene_type:complete